MTQYSIGEVSSLLNLSRDMIRYYEKQGAIHSQRNENNNYRTYDTMEVFWLLEAVQHKTWGVPINQITEMRQHQYTVSTDRFLELKIKELNASVTYQALLANRLQELRRDMSFSVLNIGNFWITEMPASYRYHLVRGRDGDDYDRINLSPEVSQFVFSERLFPFFETGLTVRDGCADWEMTINPLYTDKLCTDLPAGFEFISSSPVLCTHIDIGEIGTFNPQDFDIILDYADQHGYSYPENACIRGSLLGRGFEGNRFRRILRLYLPIAS